jgi:hypothetical protein
MKRALALLVLVAAGTTLAVTRGPSPDRGTASSHREAPAISEDPSADNTDLYAFRHPASADRLTIISNWIPAEDPAAGPMWYTFSSTARYNIYIDRNGDARPDVTYRLRFDDPEPVAFLRNTVQDYTVTRIRNGRSQVVARGQTPPNNVGPRFLGTFFKTTNYDLLSSRFIERMRGVNGGNGGRVFAGQRDDAFFGDIGAIFDLLAFRKNTGASGGGKDFFAGYAVHTIALQIPIRELNTKRHVIGIWSTTDRKRATTHGDGSAFKRGRGWVQVSRIGNPLVNEVIIPTQDKDEWNRENPSEDREFARYFRRPILARLMNQLYPGVVNAPETNRNDLVQVLLTGVPGLNKTGNRLADMLRINLSIPPTPANQVNRLGVLGGDLAGWPNGRRLEDDVIDIAERAVAGALLGNNVPLGDGVNVNDRDNLDVFPYEPGPSSGFANVKGLLKGAVG